MKIDKIHDRFDEILQKTRERRFQEGNPIVVCCTKGCFSCCKEPAMVLPQEIDHMLEILTTEEIEEVKQKTQEWINKVEPSGLLQEAQPHVLKYRALNAWCPLLKDGKCSVYKRRPYSCRAHIAISKKELCDNEDTRLSQLYLYMPEVNSYILSRMVQLVNDCADGTLELEHIGLLLARKFGLTSK